MSDKHYIPITKVDEEKRLVYLRAASETTDHSGESMDYDRSKPNFEKWSDDTYERSGGKSYGNIREMHSAIAAGKLNEPLVFDDDAKTVDIVVYVSDDSSWQKVKDGTLTGASIGGSYEDIKFDPVLGVKRYVADISEISLVDAPCNPDAVIQVVKANGAVEMKKLGSNLMKEVNMEKLKALMPTIEKSLTGDLAKSFSFDDIETRLRTAINDRLKENLDYYYGYFCVVACYDDSIVISGSFNNDYYKQNTIQVFYSIDDQGTVTLGDAQLVHMVPEPCSENGGENVLASFVSKALPITKMDISQVTEGERGKFKKELQAIMEKAIKLNGGTVMTEEEKLAKAAEDQKMEDAIRLVLGKFGTPEDLAKFDQSRADEKAALEKAKADDKAEKDLEECAKADASDGDADDKKDEKDAEKAEKAVGSEMNKADQGDALVKALGSVQSAMEAMAKRITDLEAQPAVGGPAVTAAPDKTLGGAPVTKSNSNPVDEKIAMLKGIMAGTSDMSVREAISREMATLEMGRAHANPISYR